MELKLEKKSNIFLAVNGLDSKHNYVFLNCVCFIVNSLRCAVLFWWIVPTGICFALLFYFYVEI